MLINNVVEQDGPFHLLDIVMDTIITLPNLNIVIQVSCGSTDNHEPHNRDQNCENNLIEHTPKPSLEFLGLKKSPRSILMLLRSLPKYV